MMNQTVEQILEMERTARETAATMERTCDHLSQELAELDDYQRRQVLEECSPMRDALEKLSEAQSEFLATIGVLRNVLYAGDDA